LPSTISAADLSWLNEHFHLSQSRNAEIRVAFLTAALKAGHRAVLPAAEQTLKTVGRMKYLRPLYAALKERAELLPEARRIFSEARAGYHPVAQHVMASLLGVSA